MNFMIVFCNKIKGKTNLNSILTKYYRAFLTLTAVSLMLPACEEDPTPIGTSLLPADDFATLFSTDTISIKAYTMYSDSVRTTDSLYVFGRRYNPYFGTTTAEIITQLNLLGSWPGHGFTIDSVSLVLAVDRYEGDTVLYDKQIELFEISEYLYRDTAYYSNKPVMIERLIGTYLLDTIKAGRVIEIDLPVSFGEYLMRDTSKLFISSTVPDFRDFFKGLYMRLADSPTEAFMRLSPSSSTSGIQLYYRTKAGTATNYSFVFSDKSAKYRRIVHDFSTADPARKINHINDFVLDTVVYQQKVDGVYTRIELPGLAGLKGMLPISVNKAKLIMPVYLDNDIFTDGTVPSTLFLRYTDADGKKIFIPDAMLGQPYFGGIYKSDTDSYSFNLAAFVQEYLEGRIPEPVVEIYVPRSVDADLILKANSASVRPRFELAMTKY